MHHIPTPTLLPTPRLRPVEPNDRSAFGCFLQALSVRNRALRFHGAVNPSSPRVLDHLARADGRRHIAWVATVPADDGSGGCIVGEARCIGDGETAELALAVADAWQGRGVAAALLGAVQRAAYEAGYRRLDADVLAHNERMAAFLRREGYGPTGEGDGGSVVWTRVLVAPPRPAPRRVGWWRLGWGAWAGAVWA